MAARPPRRPTRPVPTPKPAAPVSAATGRARLGAALLVFAIALAVRALHVWQIRRAPFFDLKLGDAAAYDAWARQIAAGDWIGHEIFYQAPLYPYVLAVVYTITGSSPLVVRSIQAIVSAASCALIADSASLLFGRRAGLVAGVMLAGYAPAIFLDALIQKSVLDLFFLAVTLWLVARLLSSARDWDAARSIRSPGAIACQLGLAVGCLSLTRENAGVLLVPLLLWFALERTVPRHRRAMRCALLLAGAAVIVAPVTVRNWVVGRELVLTTSQFGPNLYIGNNPAADGTYKPLRPFREKPDFERRDATAIAEQAVGRRLTPAEVSGYYTHEVIEFVRGHPMQWIRLLGRKFALAWNAVEISDTEDQYTTAGWSWPVALGGVWHFGVLAPLAALGLWLTAGEWRRLWLLYLMLASYLASLVLFYVFARYRFPLVPFLVLFAAGGLARAADSAHKIGGRQLAGCIGAAIVVALFCNLHLVAVNQLEAGTHYNVGVGLEARGDEDGALGEFETAVRLDPTVAPAHVNLGLLLGKRNHLTEAATEFELALRLAPDARTCNNLAVVLGRQGNTSDAVREATEAVRLDPQYLEARRTLASLLVSAGRPDEAAAQYREAIRLAPREAAIHREFGILLFKLGQTADAIGLLERAAALTPGDLRIRNDLAGAYARAGRLDEAAHQLRAAVQVAPDRADLHNNLGIVLAEQGQRRAAAAEFERALALNPADPQTRRNLERVRDGR